MKNINPYLSLLVLWIVAICVSLSACVIGIISDILWQALFNLAFVVFDSIWLGVCICKFNAYKQFVNTTKQLEKTLEEFIKIKENEPFKEFENNGK